MESERIPLTAPEAETTACELLQRVFPTASAPPSLQRMTDGITNVVLCARFKREKGTEKNVPERVLIRIYGRNTEVLIDREAELANHRTLHKHGMAPPIYAQFANGYAYGWCDGLPSTSPLLKSPEVYPLVARRLAQHHSVAIPGGQTQPTLFPTLRRWHAKVAVAMASSNEALRSRWQKNLDWTAVAQSIDSLEAAVNEVVRQESVVFCHNDLLAGNVIVKEGNTGVDFIDFEYGSANYRGFDIGNHFNEMCGLDTFDYSQYPPVELQQAWLRDYLAESDKLAVTEVKESSILRLFHETQVLGLASHLFWGIWAQLQATSSTIDFDYFEYSLQRIGVHDQMCDRVVEAARAYVGASAERA